MNNKKIQVIDLSPSWFLIPIIWILDTFSYKAKVNSPKIIKNLIQCQVTLVDGRSGVAEFGDFYDFDNATGEFSMHTTCLKSYQGRDRRGMIIVKFPEEGPTTWAPQHYQDILSWGEPIKTTCPYPFEAVAVKFCGITLRYEMTKSLGKF